MENEVKKQGNYLTGIIGAILGGIIATIPWVLVYVYGNMMLSLLAVIIAAGEFLGYKLFKGKIDNKLPIIIMILAIIIVTIVTLLIIPAMLLGKENLAVNMQSIKNLYTYSDFSSAIIRDYLISVVFTILGASVVTSNIKKQLLDKKNPEDIKLDLSNNEAQNKLKQDAINLMKPIFEKYNAINKENTMTKEEVLAEIENQNEKAYFNYLKSLNIIQKEKGRFYYNAENEKNIKAKGSVGKACAITIAIILIIAGVSLIFGQSKSNVEKISNDDVSFEIGTDWDVWNEYNKEYGWTYFKYISSLPVSTENVIANEIDYSMYPATIGIAYDKEATGLYDSIESLKTILETYIESEMQPEEYNINIVATEKGYSALRAKIQYTSYPEEIDYFYYIYKDGKIAYISATTYNIDDEDELESAVIDIVNSFEWKN